MSTTATAPLKAEQARRLHDAEVVAKQLKAQLEEAEKARDELRERYLDRIPLSDDPDEIAKGVRKALIGGVKIRIAPMVSAERFSMKRYQQAGHAVTDEMREAIEPGKPYNRWTVTPAAGPKKIGAVEPA